MKYKCLVREINHLLDENSWPPFFSSRTWIVRNAVQNKRYFLVRSLHDIKEIICDPRTIMRKSHMLLV